MTVQKKGYTDKETKIVRDVYLAASQEIGADGDASRTAAILQIQELTGKSVQSIRGKLGSEGIYINLTKPETKGKSGKSKADLLDEIIAGDPNQVDGFFDSLEAANKTVLGYVISLQNGAIADNFEVDLSDVTETP
jgi:hypothetical protein